MAALDRYYAHPLHTFLNERRCEQGHGQEASLCGMANTPAGLKGKWLVTDDDYPQFLHLLHDYLVVQKNRPLNLVEQPRLGQPKPLLIDLDFKFPEDSTLTHRFNAGNIRSFVRELANTMNSFLPLENYETLRFFVSTRPQAYKDPKKRCVKDGIHIQCPDIALSNDKQKVLRLLLLDNRAIENSFAGIGYVNEAADVYDETMVRKQGWFLFGESKPSIPPYKLDNILIYNPEASAVDELDKSHLNDRDLMEILSVRYGVQEDDNDVRDEKKVMYEKYLKTARPPPANTTAAVDAAALDVPSAVTGGSRVAAYIPDNYDVEEVELVKRIALECLSVQRADAYKTWMEVGWCLSNIDNSDAMFEVFVEFSKKSDKSSSADWTALKRAWARGFSRNTAGAKLTIKSIHYWAREDSPEKYKEIVDEDHIRFVQYRVDDTHHHSALLLRRIYKGRFCASVESKKTEWYVFDERIHTWRHTNQGIELREKLSTEVADLVVRARMRMKKKGWEDHCSRNNMVTGENGTPDEDWFKNWGFTVDGGRFQILVKLEKHLYSSDFKGCVMREAAELFCEEDFTNRLNMNQYLFSCKNGVIDLHNEIYDEATKKTRVGVVFRPGKPDDYMSFLAGRNYPDSEAIEYVPYDPEDPVQKELMEFLAKIFPNPEILAYCIRLMASCLEGANREQCYYTFIGVGGNGKSKLVDLMRYTFGDFCSSLSATALTRKRPDSGAANPDIIGIKNKRFIYLQEPDDREPLNTSRMKQFSGEDVVEARGLFEDQQRFRITGKLFMMCNRLPPIHAMDRGTWRRIRVLQFGSKFVDESDPELKAKRPGVYARDNDLDAKLRVWREAWLGLLVDVYEKQYLVRGLEPIPAAVMDESNKYKESFDQYGKFKAERIVDMRDSLRAGIEEYGSEQSTLKDIQVAYTNWLRQNEGSLTGKKLTKQELQNRLEEDFGIGENGMYRRVLVFFDDEGRADFLRERAVERDT